MTDEQRRVVPNGEIWPELPLEAWQDTYDTLQLWTQIVGKVRLAKAPMVNHWWQVPLYVTCRGLTTSPIPHESGRCFQIDFDFIDHRLLIEVRTPLRSSVTASMPRMMPATLINSGARWSKWIGC